MHGPGANRLLGWFKGHSPSVFWSCQRITRLIAALRRYAQTGTRLAALVSASAFSAAVPAPDTTKEDPAPCMKAETLTS